MTIDVVTPSSPRCYPKAGNGDHDTWRDEMSNCLTDWHFILIQDFLRWIGFEDAQERDSRVDERPEELAVRAHQESVPDQGRESHDGDHDADVLDTGVHVVCKRSTEAEKRK